MEPVPTLPDIAPTFNRRKLNVVLLLTFSVDDLCADELLRPGCFTSYHFGQVTLPKPVIFTK